MPDTGHGHSHAIDQFRHEHLFLGEGHAQNERKVWSVIGLCGAMMLIEIGGGIGFGSMALVADGFHMGTHVAALLIAALAYTYARRHAEDERFTFGTGKLGDLAAFASAIILAMIAVPITVESISRLFSPAPIAFNEAIPVAVLGLGVNIVSAWLLSDADHHHGHGAAAAHGHDHDHEHDHDHGEGHGDHHHGNGHAQRPVADLNHRAAYVHVLADAAVSVLAIFGLVMGKIFGILWMDPLMGLIGAAVIANWSWGLVRAAGSVLLDLKPSGGLADAIKGRLERSGDRVSDLHLWQVGPGHLAAVVSIVATSPEAPEAYKERLSGLGSLCHITIEVHAAP